MAEAIIADPRQSVLDEGTRTRVLRGYALFKQRAEEIEPLGRGFYSVPSCSEDNVYYNVDLGLFTTHQSCSCSDFEFNGLGTCKHLIAAELYRCKAQRPRQRAQAAKRRRRRVAA